MAIGLGRLRTREAIGSSIAIMHRVVILCSLLVLGPILHGASVDRFRVFPSAPVNTTPITFVFAGTGADSTDVPYAPRVVIDGSQIRITFGRDSSVCCFSATSSWYEEIKIGALPAGDYEVVTEVPGYGRPKIYRHSFIVRDVTTIPFDVPAYLNPSWWRFRLHWADYSEITRVAIGGREVEGYFDMDGVTLSIEEFLQLVRLPSGYYEASVAAGVYDVTVEWEDGEKIVANNAFEVTYEGIPAILDRYLVPVYINGGGAIGSQWESSLTIRPAAFRPVTVGGLEWSSGEAFSPNRPSGFVLGIPYRNESGYSMTLRFREATHSTAWTKLPVVRLNDFFLREVVIQDIRFSPKSRVMLRIYADDTDRAVVRVSTNRDRNVVVVRARADELAFAQIDLTPFWKDGSHSVYLSSDSPMWAFVTVTDSETNAVAVVTPVLTEQKVP